MANIYDFLASFDALWELIQNEDIEDEVIEDCFQTLQYDLKDKLENCCKFIRNQEALINGYKAEEERLNARRKAAENSVKRLKDLMQKVMEASGEKKLPCGLFTVSVQKNPKSVWLESEDYHEIPTHYLKYPEPTIDKKKIKEDLENGVELCFAHLQQTESIRIR